MSYFEAKNLTVSYGSKTILSDVSFRVEAGSITGLIGANGCGKSTLFKAICGFLPYSGSCVLEGSDFKNLTVRERSKLCGYIPQRSGIGMDISVLDVVLMGFNPKLKLLEQPSDSMRESARLSLEKVGLSGYETHNYMTLSEGQKQLVLLARTLVTDSSLYLLDEPESALDWSHRHRIFETISSATAIIAIHDPALALNYCDQLVVLHNSTVHGCIYPTKDSAETMEEVLTPVYGAINLKHCTTRSGASQWVVLREQEVTQ